MSEYLIWRDNWLIGIEDLDADHREIVRLINRLADVEDEHSVQDRLQALASHLQAHFAREETFLERIGYPHRVSHANEHSLEMAEFTLMKRDLGDKQLRALDEASLADIKTWFFNHAVAQDRLFANYFHKEYNA